LNGKKVGFLCYTKLSSLVGRLPNPEVYCCCRHPSAALRTCEQPQKLSASPNLLGRVPYFDCMRRVTQREVMNLRKTLRCDLFFGLRPRMLRCTQPARPDFSGAQSFSHPSNDAIPNSFISCAFFALKTTGIHLRTAPNTT
jgi:hypothetical protein